MPTLDASNTELQGTFTGTAKQKGASMPTIDITDGTLSGKFTGSITYDETTPEPIPPDPVPPDTGGPTGGRITEFTATPQQNFKIDGVGCWVMTAGKSWSMQKIDDYTLRFEIRPGENFGLIDSPGSVDRSEYERRPRYHDNVTTKVAFRVLLEPGPANNAEWFVVAEMHNDDEQLPQGGHTSPPWVLELEGEKFRIVARWCRPGGNPSNTANPNDLQQSVLWTQPANLVRDRWYVFEFEAKPNQTSGVLKVKMDGQQICNYTGPLGYGCDVYWLNGLYRDSGPSSNFAAKFKNLTVEPLA
jgi:hypothetical protein